MKSITWQLVVGVCFLSTLILGMCAWLISEHFAPPALLLAPISALLAGTVGATVAWTRALMKLPPAPEGTEYKLVPTIAPPPTVHDLLGEEDDEVLHVESRLPDDVGQFVATSSLPPTEPETPMSRKKRTTLR